MSSERDLDRVRAAHPAWSIRREAGPEWVSYAAQRVLVVQEPTLAGLEARLAEDDPAGSDPRVTAARELLAERHEPLTMTPGDVRQLLARYQRRLHELLEVVA